VIDVIFCPWINSMVRTRELVKSSTGAGTTMRRNDPRLLAIRNRLCASQPRHIFVSFQPLRVQ
jgi:hypothetical protein